MERPEIAAFLASAYLAAVFLWHRVTVYRRRQSGPALSLLERFDYRAVWDELLPAIPEELEGAAAPSAGSEVAPHFYARSPWELPEPPAYRDVRNLLLAGRSPDADAREPNLAWLYCHFAVRRILGGDLDGAADVACRLKAEQGERLLATIELAHAERPHGARDPAPARHAAAALAAAERAVREVGISPGLEYLLAHLRLRWFTHDANLEWSVAVVARRMRRAVRRWGPQPYFFFALAHAHALLGRRREAVDELGRALYYSQGDPFYARAILECPYVAHARPALVAQCRALCERRQHLGLPAGETTG